MNLELKTIDSAVERTAHALADWLVCQKPLTSDFPLILSSFKMVGLKILQEKVPQIARAALFPDWNSTHIETAQRLGCEAIHFHYTALTQERVQLLKKEKLQVRAYTVNEVAQATQLLQWGVDSIFTDNLSLLSQVPMSVQIR